MNTPISQPIVLYQTEIARFTDTPFARLPWEEQKNVAARVLNLRGDALSRQLARLVTNNVTRYLDFRVVARP